MRHMHTILIGLALFFWAIPAMAQTAKPITHGKGSVIDSIAPKLAPNIPGARKQRSRTLLGKSATKKNSSPRCDLNAEEQVIVQSLRASIERLRAREIELRSKEAVLRNLERQIQKDLATLRALQKEVTGQMDVRDAKRKKKQDETAAQAEEDRAARIQQLAKIMKKMKPAEAAAIIERTDTDLAVQALDALGDRIAGKIMAKLTPDRALVLMKGLVSKPVKKEAP